MLKATGGVNTHRGALFSMGLAVCAAARCLGQAQIVASDLKTAIIELAEGFLPAEGTHGTLAVEATGAKGALACAQEGYTELFDSWLPYCRQQEQDPCRNLRLLLLIMSTLDDTNVIHRTDYGTAVRVKVMAQHLFEDFAVPKMENLNERYIEDNISPGGAADMLALTLFVDKVASRK